MSTQVSTPYIVDQLKKKLKDFDAKPQDPSGVKIEIDGPAPRLVQFGGADEPTCCPPPPENTGILVPVLASYRGSKDRPVDVVLFRGLDADGKRTAGQTPDKWNPTKAEQTRSEKESVTHRFVQCVPCQSFTNERTARFRLDAFDDRHNSSHQVIGITVGAEMFERCCPNFERHRVRPVRRDDPGVG